MRISIEMTTATATTPAHFKVDVADSQDARVTESALKIIKWLKDIGFTIDTDDGVEVTKP